MKKSLLILAVSLAAGTAHAGWFGPSKEELKIKELEQANQKMSEELNLQKQEQANKFPALQRVGIDAGGAPTQMNFPEWFVNLPKAEDSFFSAGTATSSDMAMAVQKAVLDADVKLSRAMEQSVSGYLSVYKNDLGTDLIENVESLNKSVTNKVIVGHQQADLKVYQEGRIFRVYALMRYPKEEFNYFANALNRKLNREQAAVRQQATEQRLNKEIADTKATEERAKAEFKESVQINVPNPIPSLPAVAPVAVTVPTSLPVAAAAESFAIKPASSVDVKKLPHNTISDQKLRAQIDEVLKRPDAVVIHETLR